MSAQRMILCFRDMLFSCLFGPSVLVALSLSSLCLARRWVLLLRACVRFFYVSLLAISYDQFFVFARYGVQGLHGLSSILLLYGVLFAFLLLLLFLPLQLFYIHYTYSCGHAVCVFLGFQLYVLYFDLSRVLYLSLFQAWGSFLELPTLY